MDKEREGRRQVLRSLDAKIQDMEITLMAVQAEHEVDYALDRLDSLMDARREVFQGGDILEALEGDNERREQATERLHQAAMLLK